MHTQKSNRSVNDPEFAEFWGNFRLSRWKWIDMLARRSRYLVSAVLFIYIVLASLTIFPENKGDTVELPLITHGSINFILTAMILVILLLVKWNNQIPFFFQWLWKSGRLGLHDDALESEFDQYLQGYQSALLSRKEPLTISLFVLILFIALALWGGIPRYLSENFSTRAVVALAMLAVVSLFCLFMAGQAIWISFVTGRQIGILPIQFDIEIRPRHADGCGGLKPLGDFCFDAALPLIVGGLILAIVPTLRLLHVNIDADDVLAIMSASMIFVFLAPLTALTLFMPLWRVHMNMVNQKRMHEDDFVSQAMRLEQMIRDHTAEKGDLKKAEIARQKLEILQTIDPGKNFYPVWPFKFPIAVFAVFSPQILQALAGVIATAYEFIYKWFVASRSTSP